MKVCAAQKPFNDSFLCCTVLFSIKEVCVLISASSFLVLLWKAYLGPLQDLTCDLCGRFNDFQLPEFYGSLGHASGLLHLFFFLLSASLIILRAIHDTFSEGGQV